MTQVYTFWCYKKGLSFLVPLMLVGQWPILWTLETASLQSIYAPSLILLSTVLLILLCYWVCAYPVLLLMGMWLSCAAAPGYLPILCCSWICAYPVLLLCCSWVSAYPLLLMVKPMLCCSWVCAYPVLLLGMCLSCAAAPGYVPILCCSSWVCAFPVLLLGMCLSCAATLLLLGKCIYCAAKVLLLGKCLSGASPG